MQRMRRGKPVQPMPPRRPMQPQRTQGGVKPMDALRGFVNQPKPMNRGQRQEVEMQDSRLRRPAPKR